MMPGWPPTFFGTSPHKLTAKGQLTLPATVKRKLDASPGPLTLLVFSVDGERLCLTVEEEFNLLADALRDHGRMQMREDLLEATEEVNMDAQGRVVLPQHLRQMLGIEREVWLVGKREYLEVWPQERFEARAAARRRRLAERARLDGDFLRGGYRSPEKFPPPEGQVCPAGGIEDEDSREARRE